MRLRKKERKKLQFHSTHNLVGVHRFSCTSDEIAFDSEKSSGFETRDSNMFKTDLLQDRKNKNEISNEIAHLENTSFHFSFKKIWILRRVSFIKTIDIFTELIHAEKDPIFVPRQHDVIISNIFIILFWCNMYATNVRNFAWDRKRTAERKLNVQRERVPNPDFIFFDFPSWLIDNFCGYVQKGIVNYLPSLVAGRPWISLASMSATRM